jgi:hypothetical protein
MTLRRATPLLATLAVLLLPGTPSVSAAPARDCGVQSYGSGTRDRVWVLKGRTSCKLARKVFRDFFGGKGKHHSTPGQGMAGVTVTVDGWTCSYFAGGGGCTKGPARHPTASIRSIDANL